MSNIVFVMTVLLVAKAAGVVLPILTATLLIALACGVDMFKVIYKVVK